MTEISAQDLKSRLDGGTPPTLLDVRQDWETKLCRLENAVHIPIEEIELRTESSIPRARSSCIATRAFGARPSPSI